MKADAEAIVKGLNDSGKMKYSIVLKELAVTSDTITKIMKEVNYRDDVAGVITWMHTFSPAKCGFAAQNYCKTFAAFSDTI